MNNYCSRARVKSELVLSGKESIHEMNVHVHKMRHWKYTFIWVVLACLHFGSLLYRRFESSTAACRYSWFLFMI